MIPLLKQALKFGVVGGVGFAVNFVVFNALRSTIWTNQHDRYGVIYATIVATVVAIIVNWVGNRYWAFRADRQSSATREGVEFFIVSLASLAIPLLCVGISHYLMHLTSQFADNISNNVIGLALGTLFRFALYRWWVYSPKRSVSAQWDKAAADLNAPSTQSSGL